MKLIGGMLARNEDWVIGMTARAAMRWLDELIILVHASTDETLNIAAAIRAEFPRRVVLLAEPLPIWEEMRFRQAMLDEARLRGATHFATVDADEILSANLIPSIRGIVESTPSDSILQLPWVCLARGIDRYYSAGTWYANWASMAFADSPDLHWAARNGYDFHHRHPMGRPVRSHQPVTQSIPGHQGGLMHLQFLSERRLKAKQYLYQLTERLRWPDREPVATVRARYQPAVYQSDPARVATEPVDRCWWSGYEDLLARYFYPDSEPWQLGTIARLLLEHAGIGAGLDSFGLEKDPDLTRIFMNSALGHAVPLGSS